MFLNNIQHFNPGHRRFISFVAMLTAGSVDGLL
jgi:hypothetical protein